MWYKSLESITLQGSPETIWHIIVEKETFKVNNSLEEGKAVITN